jgi:hypothetical protein
MIAAALNTNTKLSHFCEWETHEPTIFSMAPPGTSLSFTVYVDADGTGTGS